MATISFCQKQHQDNNKSQIMLMSTLIFEYRLNREFKILQTGQQKFKRTITMKVSNQFNFFQPQLKKQKSATNTQPPQYKKPSNPTVQSTNKFSVGSMSSQKFQQDEQSTAGSLQNGQITEFYFQKLIHIEYQLCLVIFLNLFLIIISMSISFPILKQHDMITQKGCLYFCLICFVVQCLLLGFRTVTVLELQKEQKILYEKSTIFSTKKVHNDHYRNSGVLLLSRVHNHVYPAISVFRVNLFGDRQLLQPDPILAALERPPHSNLSSSNLCLHPCGTDSHTLPEHEMYVFLLSTKANRLCKMYGCKADFSFSLKCMFKDNPLVLIGVFFAISSMIFAFQIYLVERRAAYLTPDPKGMCNNYLNALWLVLMTITTVGYGDYFPHTSIGRIIILIVAIWGTFIVSMMVVVVSNTLTMEKNEKRTTIIINKLEMRRAIEKEAHKLIGYFILKKRSQKLLQSLQSGEHSQSLSQASQSLNPTSASVKLLSLASSRYKKYSYLCNRLQKSFSKLRKQVKNSEDIEDIEDEVSSHFLHVNSDIQILNKNQQKIISFIHEYLEYNGKNNKEKGQGKRNRKKSRSRSRSKSQSKSKLTNEDKEKEKQKEEKEDAHDEEEKLDDEEEEDEENEGEEEEEDDNDYDERNNGIGDKSERNSSGKFADKALDVEEHDDND